MPRRPKVSLPTLQHHKPSGRARVTINGRDRWLGKWGSPEARLAYDRIIAEYLATRRVRDPKVPSALKGGRSNLVPYLGGRSVVYRPEGDELSEHMSQVEPFIERDRVLYAQTVERFSAAQS